MPPCQKLDHPFTLSIEHRLVTDTDGCTKIQTLVPALGNGGWKEQKWGNSAIAFYL